MPTLEDELDRKVSNVLEAQHFLNKSTTTLAPEPNIYNENVLDLTTPFIPLLQTTVLSDTDIEDNFGKTGDDDEIDYDNTSIENEENKVTQIDNKMPTEGNVNSIDTNIVDELAPTNMNGDTFGVSSSPLNILPSIMTITVTTTNIFTEIESEATLTTNLNNSTKPFVYTTTNKPHVSAKKGERLFCSFLFSDYFLIVNLIFLNIFV